MTSILVQIPRPSGRLDRLTRDAAGYRWASVEALPEPRITVTHHDRGRRVVLVHPAHRPDANAVRAG